MNKLIGGQSQPAVEDPFLWRDRRGNFHALFHKFTDEHPGARGRMMAC